MQWAALLCFLATAVATSPQVNFSLNLQLPSVARVGKAYNFQFAATTFQPSPDQLVYSIVSGPSWLHIHSENRTLWGTPDAKDAGIATFTIVAAGEAGAVANMESKLPVENNDGPKPNGNVSQALSKAGQLSGQRSVTLLPSKPFEITLGQGVFQANGKELSYHTTLADHTPLPAWISFDAESLRFGGNTPPAASLQTFEILLIASDAPDYAAASLSFTLIVSNHLLLFKPFTQIVNVSKGEHVDIKGLRGMVFLDNAPIRDEDIQSASANVPDWLSFDTHSFDIIGNPPSSLMSQDISVVVQDKFGDEAEHSIHLAFSSQLFTGEVGRLNVTPGVYFEHNIPKSILTLERETISLEFGKLNKWLSFDPVSLAISGTIPNDTTACSVEGSMTATSSNGKTKDTQTFQIEVLGANSNGTSGPSNPDTKGNNSGGGSGHDNTDTASSSRKKTGAIVGGVLAGLFTAAIIVVLVLSLCRRKKHGKGYISPSAPRSPRKVDISRPIIAPGWGEIDRAEEEDLEKGKLDDSPPRTAELPPQLHLPLPTKVKNRNSRATSLNENEDNLFNSFSRSWKIQDEAGPSHHPHDSMKLPTDSLRRKSAGSPSQHRRRTTGMSRDSTHRSSCLPINRRLTGLGHERHTYSPSRSTNFSAAQRTLSTSSHTTAVSTVPSAFPQPSKARHTTQLTTTPIAKRQSVRLVASSTCDSLDDRIDRRSIYEKRHSYIRNRASAQSPFFTGSRVSSSSYKSPPGFISGSSSAPKSPLMPISPNIVKPDDTILSSDLDVPESLRIRKPADTPSPITTSITDFSLSLRKNKPTRSLLRRYTDAASSDRGDEPPTRPGTTVYAPTSTRSRTSTRSSLRGPGLKKDINKMVDSEIFNDTEVSENDYPGEEDDIEESERRVTIKPSNSMKYLIEPLNFERGKREGNRESKQLKRTSERDPTPFSRSLEHGEKENLDSPTYSLTGTTPASQRMSSPSTSPSRPKTAAGHRPHHSRNFSRALPRPPSTSHPLPRIPSTKERHSRKSIHSRSQSRHKKPRDRSRTQSGAYPHFRASTKAAERSSATTRPRKNTVESTTERDDKGNILHYAEHEAPCIEEFRRESIGRVKQRHSKIALHMHTSPFYHSKRDTAISSPLTPTSTAAVGLGFSLLEGSLAAEDATPGPESAGRRERTPLSVLDDGNGSPERLRFGEGKGRRPVSVEVGEEKGGRKKVGSLKGVLGRGWSGSIWDGRESKAFL